MPFYLLALLGLAGCVAEPPVTTTTTTTTTRETVTTGPRTVERDVLVTEAPPPVRVETRSVAPGPGYVWTSGYWRWTGARYEWVPGRLDCASANDGSMDGRSLGTQGGRLGVDRRSLAVSIAPGSIEQIDFAGKGIDLLNVGMGAFVDLCIDPRRDQFG
jgi:hypothetical protein